MSPLMEVVLVALCIVFVAWVLKNMDKEKTKDGKADN